MSAFSYGRFLPSSKAEAPKLAAATQAQGQLDTASQSRADALRGQNMNAVGNLGKHGYGMYKDGMFDSMFEPATDLGLEAGADVAGMNMGTVAPITEAVPMGAVDLGVEAGATMGANAIASGGAAGSQALAAAMGFNPMTAATAAAAPAAGAGLASVAGAALPPLAIALLASELFG